jgi:nicotinamidase/pyrazinamidase
MNAISLTPADALIVVDMQNDFLPGGALGVPRGDEVLEPIRQLIALYRRRGLPVYASRDWHPADHVSFRERGGPWPPHCIAGTPGAEFSTALELTDGVKVISKATTADVDAYSAFNGTELADELRDRHVERVAVCGLATDYCVLNTVLDALTLRFKVIVLPEATRAVDVKPGDGARAVAQMVEDGAVAAQLAGEGLIELQAIGQAQQQAVPRA